MIPPQTQTEKEHILIVDDTPANLRLLMSVLMEQGYIVRPVPDGQLALQSALAVLPDLILLDINMPQMSGYDVCKSFKQEETTRDIPIIFISVKDQISDKVKAFALGGVDYITKPFQAEEVLVRVETHLEITRLQRSIQAQNIQLEREIQERARAEEEIRTLNVELEQRIQQRTSDLEEVNRDLQNFVYAASHDLKTPLRGIHQLAYWLTQDYPDVFDETGKEMVALLMSRIDRMDNLLNGILEYANVIQHVNQLEWINLQDVVQQMIAQLMIPEQIRLTIDNELPTLKSNRRHLHQVFYQLITNAVKFMGSTGGSIRIGSQSEEAYWKFWVADDGPGIKQQYHEKIFHMFQTLERHHNGQNVGIGLALVKKVVDSYHGKIWLDSTPGVGSTFFFLLPKHNKKSMHTADIPHMEVVTR